MKKIYFFLFILFSLVGNSFGQLTEGFESGMPTGYTTGSITLGSGTWTATNIIRGTTGVQSGSYSCQIRSATGANIITPNITAGVGVVSFYASSSTTSGSVQVNYSTDGGGTWTAAPGSPFSLTTGTPALKTTTINSSAANILVQFYRTAATVYIDDVNISTYSASSCSISSLGLSSVTCNDNSTATVATDDYITFDLNPTGSGLGSNYNVSVSSGTVTPTSGTYGSATSFSLQNGSAGAGDVTVTVTDVTTSSCNDNVTVTDPGSCSANAPSVCLSVSSFSSMPSGWDANSVTYSSGEAVFGSTTGDLTTLAIANPASVTFDLRRTTNSNAKTMYVEVSTTSQTSGFTIVDTYTHSNTTSGGTTPVTVDLSSYTAYPTVYIRLRKASSTTSPWYVSNFNVYCGTPCTEPITQASSFGTGTINMNDAAITWTRGSGTAGVIVVARASSAVNADPVSGISYTANASFGSGTEIGTGNFVIYKGTGTGVTVSGLTSSTTYHFAVYEYNSTDICYNITELTGNLTTLPANVVLSSTNPAVTVTNITQGANNNVIYKFALTPSGGSVDLTGVTFTTTGTYAASNINNFKVWYSADATFDAGTDTYLDNITSSLGIGNHSFSGFSQTINNSTTSYIFITTDLPCTATEGNTIIVNAVTTANLTFTAANKSGIAYNGSTQTILSATPSNVTGLTTTSCENGSVTVSWTSSPCYDNFVVVASPTALTTAPSGNGSAYTANTVYGSGTAYDGGFVVYKNNASSVTITGLTNGTNYTYTVFTRNDLNWSSGVSVNCTPTLVYCTAASTNSSYEYIEGVTLNTINNTSSSSYYSDFTSVSTDLAIGQTYTLSVYNGDYYSSDILIAWIDWNNDGDFTDAGEEVFQSTYGDPAPYITNITVPATATIGSVKMRLRLFDDDYTSNYTPCGTHQYGEVEDYTLNICNPAHTISSIAPTEGPVGTYVRITGTGLTSSSSVSFNGVASIDIQYLSATEIIARVPSGATTGSVSVVESGCSVTLSNYTVIKESGDCIGSTSFSDLIISEVYDADASNRFYVELFNPTSSPIDLSVYTIKIDNRSSGDAGVTIDRTVNLSGTVQPGATFLLNLGTSSNTCTKTWDFTLGGNGINEYDYVFLAKNGTDVDRVDLANNTGYTFKRKATASGPTTTYNGADWDILNVEDCSHLGIPPVATNPNPIAVLTNNSACNIDLSVAITEGDLSTTGDLTYKWYYNDTYASGWTLITASIPSGYTITGYNTANLIIANGTNSVYDLSDYQFYCEVTEAGSCKNVSIASNFTTVGRPIYRSKVAVNGNWTTVANWEMAFTTAGPWVDACDYPTASNSSEVIIQSGTRIALDIDNDIDKITVEATATLEILPDSRLTLYDANAGADFILSGTLLYRANSANTLLFEDPAGTPKATWVFNSGATFIKTNTSSADDFKTYYEGGMVNMPSAGTWIYRYNGDGNPYTGATDFYYPDLYFENTANSSLFDFNNTLMALTGASAKCTVYGSMFVGTTGTGQVKVYNNNINTEAMLVNGNLTVGAGSTFTNELCSCSVSSSRDNGTGLEIKGDITNNGTLDINSANVGKLEFSGTTTQIVQGAGSFDLYNVELDKTAQTLVDQRVDLTANNNLNFIGGIIKTSANVFTVANAARTTAITGYDAPNTTGTYSNDKYVHGNLERNMNTTGNYEFPVGDAVAGEAYNPVVLDIKSGSGYATAKFIAGDPGTITVPFTEVTCSGATNFIEYTDMTGEGWWNFVSSTSTTFSYDIYLHPNVLNANIYPNDDIAGYKNNYRALKATTGTGGGTWPPSAAFDGDECIVSTNYYEIIGAGYSGFSDFAPGGGSGNTTALPVELLSFSANCNNDGAVTLSWSTASEINSQSFIIEKSTDGIHFETLTTVNAAGFSTEVLNYSYIDNDALDMQYYRLKQIDFDGTVHTFNITLAKCGNYVDGAEIYYQSGVGIHANIQNGRTELMRFELYQLDGKLLFNDDRQIQQGYNAILLDDVVNQLAEGVYVFRIVGEHKTYTEKLYIK